jgi:ADP-ribose pyrophosphatase YjhB (NUDIX family)
MHRGKAEYLLVESKNDPDQWVLPKGHVEEDEQHRETAVREVREETGVWARIVQDLGNVSYTVNGSVVSAHFFLMRAIGRGLRKEKDRRHKWLELQEAGVRANHMETRELLQVAERRRVQLCSESNSAAKRRAPSA